MPLHSKILLGLLLGAVTYGLQPYGSSPMGWGNPWVVASLVGGVGLLVLFVVVEPPSLVASPIWLHR